MVGTNFCFTYPYFAIDFSLTGYPLTFLIMAAVAVITCALTVNMRKQRDEAHRREQMAQLLNEMDQKLLQMDTKEQIATLLLDSLYTQLQRPIFYLERQGDNLVSLGQRGEAEATLPAIYYETVRQSLEQKKIIRSEISAVQQRILFKRSCDVAATHLWGGVYFIRDRITCQGSARICARSCQSFCDCLRPAGVE